MDIPQTGGTFIRDPETGALAVVVEHTKEAKAEAVTEAQASDPTAVIDGSTVEEPMIIDETPPDDAGAAAAALVDVPAEEAKTTTKKKVK